MRGKLHRSIFKEEAKCSQRERDGVPDDQYGMLFRTHNGNKSNPNNHVFLNRQSNYVRRAIPTTPRLI
jgi:hypothetical protein